MLFTSYEFIGFVALLFVLYFTVPKKTQWWLLLAASYVFYALADLRYLIFIAATTVTSYIASRLMGRVTDKETLFLEENRELLRTNEKPTRLNAKRKDFGY